MMEVKVALDAVTLAGIITLVGREFYKSFSKNGKLESIQSDVTELKTAFSSVKTCVENQETINKEIKDQLSNLDERVYNLIKSNGG